MNTNEKIDRIDRLAKSGQNEAAIRLANEFLRHTPDDVELLAMRAHLHADAEEYQAAIGDLSRALEFAEGDPGYLFTRGRYRLAVGDFGGAAEDFTGTLRFCDENASDFHREMAYFLRAEAYLGLRRYDDARADCDKVRDGLVAWTTTMRSKEEILEACRKRR